MLGCIAPAGFATSLARGRIRVTSALPAAAPLRAAAPLVPGATTPRRVPALARSLARFAAVRPPGVALTSSRVAAVAAVLAAAAPVVAAAPPLSSAPRPRHQPLPKIIATLGSAGSTLSVTASPVANGADG